MGEGKELCMRGSCTTTDIMTPEEGLCGGMSVFLCITEHGQIPPLAGAPKCICFNKPLAPGGEITRKDALFDYKQIFDETFWLYYMFCVGCGFIGIGKGRPVIGSQYKECCIKGGSNFEKRHRRRHVRSSRHLALLLA